MMEAPSGMRGSAFCTVKSTPLTLMSKIESKSSSEISPSRPYCATPAFAKSTSSLPFSDSICANRRSRSARFDTSPWTPVTPFPISFTAANECDLSFQLTHIFLLARQCTLLRKPVAEHRFTALGLFLRCLVLDYIPMLHEESVFNTQDVSRNPVDRSTKPGKPSVHDDEIPVRYDYPRFILQG